jgi:PPOX class probable F420-dependent enzyme
MPGYGIRGATEGSGLLPWSWAESRLTSSRNYWAVTVWPDGRPHAMPVWAMWDSATQLLWFTSSLASRKARNVAANGQCVLTTEDADNPVVVQGVADIVADAQSIAHVIALMNEKYATTYSVDFLDPAVQATMRVRPRWAFALAHDDFTGSPTRWVFQAAAGQ